MELNVKLTADELQDVVDAAMDEAIDRGYEADDETVDDMLHIVDAALSAMGIEIVPADEEEEDEEDDPIEAMCYTLDDGRTAISFEDACFLLDMIQEVGEERGLSEDEATEAAKCIFLQIAEDYGIEAVEAEDEDDEEEEDEPEYPDNPVSRCVFVFEGKRVIKESDADEITEALAEVIEDKLGFLPEVLKKQIQKDMLTKVFEDNGIEGVVRGR